MWKRLESPSTDERKNTVWHIHAMEYYLVMKRNEDYMVNIGGHQKHAKRPVTKDHKMYDL